ncbi:unnamed protein product [Soboliphyme baturini]|uniref:Rab-GAP TBC domain-containing protein n=1 Tax=Soboliphyme baturini TaxID=241478 RepID=A0A183J8X6_9BILA|nr:unnamed protein product [Soboliphyme baturini]
MDEVCECLGTLESGDEVTRGIPMEQFFRDSLTVFSHRWKMKDQSSELAFQGLLLILEYSLSCALANHLYFACFIEALGYHTVFFWKKAVPLLFDSDMQYGTSYRDCLLLR